VAGTSLDPIQRAIEEVPSYPSFMTYRELEESTDRLAEEFRGVVRVVDVGRSRCGERIRAVVIGGGSRAALLFGAPHPNEPVGTLTLDYLSWRLASDEELREVLDYTWVIVKVADVDGLKLNEGWFKEPFSAEVYARNYYRPAGNVQVEWSFPVRYKRYSFEEPTPEARCLMDLVDEYRPDFIYSLHNSGFGGVYYYVSARAPLLYPILQLYPRSLGIPLSLGEPEVPWVRQLTRAVYLMPSVRDYYDFLEAQGMDPVEVIRHGGSSYDYAREVNPSVVELVTEVPYLYDPRVEDLGETEVVRRRAVLDAVSWNEGLYEFLSRVWARARDLVPPGGTCTEVGLLRESFEYFLETAPKSLEATRRWALSDPSLERRATVAEVFDNYYVNKFYGLLRLGTLLRLLGRVYEQSPNPTLGDLVGEVEGRFLEVLDELERDRGYRTIEIRDLVRVQLAAGLYTALYVQQVAGLGRLT
jgi:hypothetical protein